MAWADDLHPRTSFIEEANVVADDLHPAMDCSFAIFAAIRNRVACCRKASLAAGQGRE